MTLDDFEDIEQLRDAAKLLDAEVQSLTKRLVALKRENFELKHGKAEQLELQKVVAELEEQLARRNKLLFGDKSEKRPKEKPKREKSKQTGHGPREQKELEVVEQLHTANFEDACCDLCGGSLKASEGFVEESEEVDVIERRFVIKKHNRQKYKCECGSCIKTAPGPQKLLNAGRYSVGFAVHVAMAKYGDHMPLERQARGMKRDGLLIDSQTLWDQLNALAKHLEPAWERLKSYVLTQPVIGADETHWKLLSKSKKKGGDGKRWQVWAICSPDAVHYSFEDSRSAAAAQSVLDDFSGVVISDGYAAYGAVQKRGGRFSLAHCWSHVRRKFVEVEESHPGKCETVLDLIGKLNEVERDAKGRPPDEVLTLRREKSKPIILAIQDWALEVEALPQSSLSNAIKYMGSVWSGLRVFLDNANVSLDNNATERALRGIVVGRKNHYGSKSEQGTKVAAILYSLIESAKLAGVNPQAYLQTAINAALRGSAIPLPHETA
jgi:transposase